jgi:4-hydroxy-3-methylbut-2-enyl diphosphate reductase
MKITVAKSAGFCFGVRRALNISLDAVTKGKPVEMLGDIVHNEDVVAKIEQSGIKKVSTLKNGADKILLIRAHGISESTIKKAQSLGYNIINATCPRVKEIHNIVQTMDQQGYSIIVIGDRKHDEVKGIRGQIKSKTIVIENIKYIPFDELEHMDKAAVVAQSTQMPEHVLEIVEIIKQRIKNLAFFNTICRATKARQNEIKTLCMKNDVVFVIGSKTSGNTKRLYKISKALNKHTHWIQSKDNIKPDWFQNAQNVGITAGASTPEETIQSVVAHIKTIHES